MNILIQAGERPLFKALNLVETIHTDMERCGNPYDTVSSYKIHDYVAQLHVLAEIIKIRAATNRSMIDLNSYLNELPLFFNTHQTTFWEKNRPWSNAHYCNYQSYVVSYTQIIESYYPSKAYQINKDASKYIWDNWLEKTSTKEVVQTLIASAHRLMQWESFRPKASNLYKNINYISNLLGTDISDSWYYLTVAGNSQTQLWDIYIKESGEFPVEKLIAVWEKSFNLKSSSINSLLSIDSNLVKKGMLNPVEVKDDWNNTWKNITPSFMDLLYAPVLEPKNLLSFFANQFNTTSIALDNFNYLDNFEILNLAIHKPLKILIYGQAKTGRKSLASSLLKENNLTGWTLKESNNGINDFVKNLEIFTQVIQSFKNDILIVNVSDISKQLNSFLKKETINTQLWLVDDIKKLTPEIIEDFDIVIETKPMPIEERLKHAKKIFTDSETALRVARTVRSHHDIIKLNKWCALTKDYSWSNVSQYLLKFSNLTQAISDKGFTFNKVEIAQNIPQLAGYQELDELLEQVVHIFNNTEQYQKLDAKPPKGILLLGPPGTGKTYFAKNLSKKINIPMYAPDTSALAKNPEIISKVFAQARQCAPCILFMDEIDTLITDPNDFGTVNLEKQKIINSFLAELDGVNLFEGVLVIGATHRGGKIDKAATRAGRLSEIVTLSLPEKSSRMAIWESHLKFKPVGEISLDTLAQVSSGFSGAEIAEVINKSAVYAARKSQAVIEMQDMIKACDEVFWGTNDYSKKPNNKELMSTAYHEAGHALIAIKNNLTVQRITIRPKQGFLGAVHSTPDEGSYTMDMTTVKSRVQMLLAGIASEKLKFNQYGNGGGSDLQKCKEVIHAAILSCGLGSMGPMSASNPNLWSEDFKQKIEYEEKKIMDSCFEQVTHWLKKHIDLLDDLAQELYEKKEVGMENLKVWQRKIYAVTDIDIEKLSTMEEIALSKTPKKDI